MVYCNDDPLMAKRLENSGADAIMPLAAPIGLVQVFKIKQIFKLLEIKPNYL